MSKIKVFGILYSHYDKVLFDGAIDFFKRILEIDKISIIITLKKMKNGVLGTCIPIRKNDKIIAIKINITNKGTILGIIEALAHEMVHAKQYIDKNIKNEIKWKYYLGIFPYLSIKKYFNGKDVTNLSYYEQPSEIEAHILQKYLTFLYLKSKENFLKPINLHKLLVK